MSKDKINIYGTHAVTAVCQHYPELVFQLSISKDHNAQQLNDIFTAAKRHNIPVKQVSRTELDKLCGAVHQGVMASCRQLETSSMEDLPKLINSVAKPFLLILDGVQDPHNLGACMRSANAMGVTAVIVPKQNSCGLTSVVHKVSCGASLLTPLVAVSNLARTLDLLAKEGVWMVGMDASAKQELQQVDMTGSIAIVMGAEGSGLRRLTIDKCDYLAKLPMPGDMESLNVSVATGMALYEVVRQR